MTDESTNMTQEWIDRVVKANPCVALDNGNIRTCPVRLSFVNFFDRAKPVEAGKEGAYGANLIFPLSADLAPLQVAAADTLKSKCPEAFDSDPAKRPKVKSPFKDQGEMLKYNAYQVGGTYIIATSRESKPSVVDQRLAPIIEKTKALAGYWAICTVRPFWYNKGVNKGVSFGLQSVMIIAEDKVLSGGGENVSSAFAGVSIDASVNPAAGFGQEAAFDPFA